ncbi:RbsD/FucU domain-containing protein [Fulvimarina sp. MAC8]|uniref:RbsD/FucU family protein n=1 Tax=Fulvimarina sp. MAC8 TaxID=3162874 RepID=UPI0032EA9E0C
MLKGIDPLIGPDLIHALAQMGHGDEIVIADANFPSYALARKTVYGSALTIGCDAVTALRAILSLFPLDEFEPDAVMTMQVVNDPEAVPPVVAEAAPILDAAGHQPKPLERFAFYERAARAFAVVHTLEGRSYGNFILRKGVVFTS